MERSVFYKYLFSKWSTIDFLQKPWFRDENFNVNECIQSVSEKILKTRKLDKVCEFSVVLAIQIHQIVGEKSCGQYRTSNVRVLDSSIVFCPYSKIASRMDDLFLFVKQIHSSLDADKNYFIFIRKTFLLMALFLSEFLQIHPFSDGNSKVAQMLINFLFENITRIPITFYFTEQELYKKVLELRNDGSPPKALATYLLVYVEKWFS
jgi:fido (protein-threonine AMPylation protein)